MIKEMKTDPKSAKKSVSKIAKQAENASINQTYSLEGISEINETDYEEEKLSFIRSGTGQPVYDEMTPKYGQLGPEEMN